MVPLGANAPALCIGIYLRWNSSDALVWGYVLTLTASTSFFKAKTLAVYSTLGARKLTQFLYATLWPPMCLRDANGYPVTQCGHGQVYSHCQFVPFLRQWQMFSLAVNGCAMRCY